MIIAQKKIDNSKVDDEKTNLCSHNQDQTVQETQNYTSLEVEKTNDNITNNEKNNVYILSPENITVLKYCKTDGI